MQVLEAGEMDINIDTTDMRLGGFSQLYEWLVDFPVEVRAPARVHGWGWCGSVGRAGAAMPAVRVG